MTTQPARAERSDNAAPPATGSTPTLLIVDDEAGPRQALQVIFNGDYNVLTAEDGFTAIEIAQRQSIDVAILDIRMASMSGIEVLERLQFVDPTIAVIMMTAYETTETLRQAMHLSASDYITKPFDVSTMRRAVARALERRSLARSSVEKVEELKSALEKTKSDEELSRMRNDLYENVLHDINSPLTIISGLTQLINQRIGSKELLEGEDLQLIKDHLTRITRQVTVCTSISRRYLDTIRQSPNDSIHVSVGDTLRDVNELLRFHPSLKNHELIVKPPNKDVNAAIGGTDLIQILMNLGVNALQATLEQHRVEISAERLERELDVRKFIDGPTDRYLNLDVFRNQPPLALIRVEDTGPGIPPPTLAKLFQAYFTTKPRGQGTGLGLCIVQRLLAEAYSALHLHSVVGRGTVFTLYIPARTH